MRIAPLVAALLAVCCVDVSASLRPGELDPTFGFGGQQTVPVDIASASEVNAITSVIGPDGRIYLVGTALDAEKTEAMAIMRLDKNGAIDTGFGTQGVLVHRPQGVSMATARDATFDDEGRLVAAGQAMVNGQDAMIACRFVSDGAPDPAFGSPVTPGCYSLVVDDGVAESVLVQNGTGRVILAGNFTSMETSRGLIAGLLPDGSGPDATFGSGFGLQFLLFGIDSPGKLHDVTQNSAGQIGAAGFVEVQPGVRYALAARLNANGDLFGGDQGFDTIIVGFDPDAVNEATAVVLFDDESLVLAYSAQVGTVDFRPALIRILTDGSVDAGFDYEGSSSSPTGGLLYDICDAPCDMRPHDVAVLPNGNIVMSGTIRQGVEGDTAETLAGRGDFFVMRLLPNGKPDPTFRSPGSTHDGLSIIPFDTYSEPPEDGAYSLAVQGDRLLVAGLARTDNDPDNDVPEFNAAIARIGNGNPLFADSFE